MLAYFLQSFSSFLQAYLYIILQSSHLIIENPSPLLRKCTYTNVTQTTYGSYGQRCTFTDIIRVTLSLDITVTCLRTVLQPTFLFQITLMCKDKSFSEILHQYLSITITLALALCLAQCESTSLFLEISESRLYRIPAQRVTLATSAHRQAHEPIPCQFSTSNIFIPPYSFCAARRK